MPVTRRQFLLRAAALAAFGKVAPIGAAHAQRFAEDPFKLGIASGYPHESGVTLWTRLAPRPLAGGGMPATAVEVQWEVGGDEGFRSIAARGKAIAAAQWAHSVHVDATGLQPGRPYWYLGDYIYESSWGRNLVRSHGSDQPYTLTEYRTRHALYKTDEDLRAAHAAFPWIVTWDDHEVQNDYANDRSQDLDPADAFLLRRAAAYQAYYEHMPLPAWARPRGPDMRLHTTVAYGRLATFFVLDDRQYRSHQVCARPGRGGSTVVREELCPERVDPALTLLGRAQEQWLDESFGRTGAAWNVIAQQTLMAQADRRPGPGGDYWTDGWDGYPRARERLLESVVRQRVRNPLVISGDVHMSAISDLKVDFDAEKSPVVATEIAGPSITSQGPAVKRVEALLQENPHIRFANGARRGYATLDITPTRCIARLRTLATVTEPTSDIRTLTTYAIEDGRPGAHRA
jgi:alkaline phosphatase D